MIIDDAEVFGFFEKDIYSHYVEYGDFKAVQKDENVNRKYFSTSYENFVNNQYIIYTEYEDEILIEICQPTDCYIEQQLIEEVYNYAEKYNKPILLLAELEIIEKLSAGYVITVKQNTGYEHYGVYGCAQQLDNSFFIDNSIQITSVSQEDKNAIAQLPVAEWGNLPIMIRFTKDIDKIFLAKINDKFAGYIIHTSSYENYTDIVNVMVHPLYRQKGIGKALINFLATKVDNKIYYGSAKSINSSKLAESLGFEKIINSKKTWLLTKLI